MGGRLKANFSVVFTKNTNQTEVTHLLQMKSAGSGLSYDPAHDNLLHPRPPCHQDNRPANRDGRTFQKILPSKAYCDYEAYCLQWLGWQIKERFTGKVQISAVYTCLLYTSPSPRDGLLSRMPSSA